MSDRITQLKAFLIQSPNDCLLHHALALEYIKTGDDETAKSYFERNLTFDAGYIATYYHLGMLLERQQEEEKALHIYQQGMEKAKAAGDTHSYNELRGAYENLTY